MLPPVNPFASLAGAAGKVVADAWTTAMLGLWNAGLWALRFVLNLMDLFLTPDLRTNGPAAELYRTSFWLAGTLVVILALVQLGVAAWRRDGRSLAQVLVGAGQFVVVWAGWISYGVALVAATGGLTKALMGSLLNVTSWSAWQPWAPVNVEDITDATVATVLGLMGLLLWLSAIGHLLVMLTRAGALMVLAAVTPVTAAGLVSDLGREWFWKSLRWFHAAALTPVLMVLVLGIGVQMTTGVANGLAEDAYAGIGTALPGVVLILIGCFVPLVLFRLLAFVDPGTTSGAAMRQGLAAQGGIQGLLAGSTYGTSGSGSGSTSGAASNSDSTGRAQGESAGEDTTSSRFTSTPSGFLSSVGGAVGQAAATGLGVMSGVATAGAGVASDVTSQMGVGNNSYHPDFIAAMASRGPRRMSDTSQSPDALPDPQPSGGDTGSCGSDTQPPTPTPPASPPTPPSPPPPPAPPDPDGGGGSSGGGSSGGGSSSGTGGGSGAAGGRAAGATGSRAAAGGGASSAEVAAVAI